MDPSGPFNGGPSGYIFTLFNSLSSFAFILHMYVFDLEKEVISFVFLQHEINGTVAQEFILDFRDFKVSKITFFKMASQFSKFTMANCESF